MMDRIQRAHIFSAFDALKGFREILHEKERIVVPKKSLSEDDYELLNYKVHQIKEQMIIGVTVYEYGEHIRVEGMVSKINLTTKIIQIVKKKINLNDIVDIDLEPSNKD